MKFYLFAVPLMLVLASGCATHGRSKAEQEVFYCKSLCFAETAPFDQVYIPQVAGQLKELGFEMVTDTSRPDTLVCRIASAEGGSFEWSFEVSFWQGKKKVLFAEAVNDDLQMPANPQAAKYRVVDE